ncbi:hypothetical protein J1N10_05955 [Carboxylicivirga sp. A043]|uniref:hypothetical protein n=1 Tax=Carboxylicivirga litoralis TaxID=2816963 RepID=UPI0021CB0EAA|nr:hypothetical protein [Carboxylicivirga sp. A043]MCU4155511.1 hypothetical protein [Carboxylicivirga sp. A043]
MNDKVLFLCDINHVNSKVLHKVFDMAFQESNTLTVLIIYNRTSLFFGDYGSQSSPLLYLENDLRRTFIQRYKTLFGNVAANDIHMQLEVRFANHDASLKPYIDNYGNWFFEHKSLATRLNPGGLLNKLNTKKHSVKVIAKNGKLIDLQHASFFNFSFIQSNRLFWDNSPLELGML